MNINTLPDNANPWVGRFAPTPSGPLHFGSLVAALGSYLIAKHANGEWLLRIEDLDPPRVKPGAAESIIKTLEAFGFEWDREIVYQSQRSDYYQSYFQRLLAESKVYACNCSRKQIAARNLGVYDGYCREKVAVSESSPAYRAKFNPDFQCFHDCILGACQLNAAADLQDFVVRRRDGLFAYQLAVVVDDIEQGITHLVRGADILDSTPRQNFLYACFQKTPPDYFHLPLVVDTHGKKLSKHLLAPEIAKDQASELLVKALKHLNQPISTDLHLAKPKEILESASTSWQLEQVGKVAKTVDII